MYCDTLFAVEPEENENLNQVNPSPGRDSNQASPEYESKGLLQRQPVRSQCTDSEQPHEVCNNTSNIY